MRRRLFIVLLSWLGSDVLVVSAEDIVVANAEKLRDQLRKLKPGTQLQLAPGQYGTGFLLKNIRGTESHPIVITAQNKSDPPVFRGRQMPIHIVSCSHLTLSNLRLIGSRSHGINVDDGGHAQMSEHIRLVNLQFRQIGSLGGSGRPVKMAGVVDFSISACDIGGFRSWAVDLVGCHRGIIEDCRFHDGGTHANGVQIKGGSRDITLRNCFFQDAGRRGVSLGGSTGKDFFRPKDATYEAKNIIVEGCTFVRGHAPIVFVGVDGAIVRFNTIVDPATFVLRILQESTDPRFVRCRNGRFYRNLIVFKRARLRRTANVGPHTRPESFRFAENLWHFEDGSAKDSVSLPTREFDGVYDVDPKLVSELGRIRVTSAHAEGYGAHALSARVNDKAGQDPSTSNSSSPGKVGAYYFIRSRLSRKTAYAMGAVTAAIVVALLTSIPVALLWRMGRTSTRG